MSIFILFFNYACLGEQQLYFETAIRPILKEYCFHCHGENGEVEGKLDLRLKRLILKGGKSGAAIVPHAPEKSLLFEKIIHGDMPEGEVVLGEEKIKKIRKWILQGAKNLREEPLTITDDYIPEEERQFWAFQPIEKPNVPKVRVDEIRNPIDAFIFEKLKEKGLGFSELASKESLIRRATYDLHGLPPTPQEVEAFLRDDSPDAYEKLIETLLKSPRYGEKWGRHWLDVSGYADSEGYNDSDAKRDWAWMYRDYVIRSFNDDKPFDQFVQELLAGDEMVKRPLINLDQDQKDKLIATGFLRMAPDGTGGKVDDMELAKNKVVSETLKIVSASLLGMTVACAECHDHRYDPISQKDYYELRAIFEPAFNLEQWKKPQQRKISLYTKSDREKANIIHQEVEKLKQAKTDREQHYIKLVLDWKVGHLEPELAEKIKKAYFTKDKERSEEQKKLMLEYPKIKKLSASSLYLYDRELKANAKACEKKINEIKLKEIQNEEDKAELKSLIAEKQRWENMLSTDNLIEHQERIDRKRGEKPEEQFIRALVEDQGALPKTHIYHRGNYKEKREEVSPEGLDIIANANREIPSQSEAAYGSGRRLAYARYLTSGEHPLLSRVIVNRVWMKHFGKGMVNTPDDFGHLGERPSHPELLDWLATHFVENNWSLKHLHKLMMTSYTYQQKSWSTEAIQKVDPDNRLLAHMPVRRMEAETIRDALLYLSADLSPKMFGKPVGVIENSDGMFVIGEEKYDRKKRKQVKSYDLGEENFRRSVYIEASRTKAFSFLNVFDMPAMEDTLCAKRSLSNVAPQALIFMNSDFVINATNRIAERHCSDVNQPIEVHVKKLWRLILNTEPSQRDIDDAKEYVSEQSDHFKQGFPKKYREKALASFCHALLSSNSFFYIH